MHTLAVIVGGILLLGVFVVLGRMFSGASTPAFAIWALYFIPVWLIASATNMWIGIRNAGYSFAEELPIFFSCSLCPVQLPLSCGGNFLDEFLRHAGSTSIVDCRSDF